jgi:cyclic pyranopterin phosphate synthase
MHTHKETVSAPTLVDQYGRIKRKLRISVTDRCNFKCVYCMPDHPQWLEKSHLLSFEALSIFCRLMVEQGVTHIRITGGEPLMRQNIPLLIEQLNTLRRYGLKRLSMTTNAYYLSDCAQALKAAGLDDINISLDSVDADTFFALTKKDLAPVLQGIVAAQQAGLSIKLNAVLIKGINDQQMLPLVAWAKARNLPLRFIEYMPLDGNVQWQREQVVTEADILKTLQSHYSVTTQPQGSAPARSYRLDNQYPIGIISTISNPFCHSCDRIRLTSTGELLACLFSQRGYSLKPLLDQLVCDPQAASVRAALLEQVKNIIWHKSAGYASTVRDMANRIPMYAIGG